MAVRELPEGDTVKDHMKVWGFTYVTLAGLAGMFTGSWMRLHG